MKRKAEEKLFYLAYTDAMTGVYNRNAYEEHILKLNRGHIKLDNMTVVSIKLDDLNEIRYTMGNRTGDEALKLAASCIINTVGEKADVYRMDDDEFLCIAEGDIVPYISKLYDLIGMMGKDKKYPLNIFVGYMKFDNKKHRNIDELIKECDRQLIKEKKKALV